MRLFVAIEAPLPWQAAARSVRRELERAVGGGRPPGRPAARTPALRWVDPGLMHLTLRFLGEVTERRLPALHEALIAQCSTSPSPAIVEIGLGEARTVGPAARATVVSLAVNGSGEGLSMLAARVESAVTVAELPPEGRPFRPHLTLARLRPGADARTRRAVAAAVVELGPPPPLPVRVTGVALMRSHLSADGPRYERLAWYELPS